MVLKKGAIGIVASFLGSIFCSQYFILHEEAQSVVVWWFFVFLVFGRQADSHIMAKEAATRHTSIHLVYPMMFLDWKTEIKMLSCLWMSLNVQYT